MVVSVPASQNANEKLDLSFLLGENSARASRFTAPRDCVAPSEAASRTFLSWKNSEHDILGWRKVTVVPIDATHVVHAVDTLHLEIYISIRNCN